MIQGGGRRAWASGKVIDVNQVKEEVTIQLLDKSKTVITKNLDDISLQKLFLDAVDENNCPCWRIGHPSMVTLWRNEP